ncbi:MAG: peptidase S16 [Candidatus Fonsibacter ubiquis]|nr:peptidase S16 [Candidatus Fonsibacter ubiquis]
MTTLNKKEIPQEISIFPLANAVFFPNTILPLNIFEPRYKKMVEDALSSNKMIGMIQTKQSNNLKKPEVFSVGCLGKIENHTKTADGRYLINLKGDVLQLIDKARKLFKIHQLSTDWKIVEKVEPDQLINSLSMICPFSVSEKQGLLEAKTILERNLLINQIINFYIIGNNPGSERQIH